VGNILWRDDTAHFVDLDDCCTGPAVQDLWMLLSGERHERQLQLSEIMEGYAEFCDFDPRQLRWIEALRSMRLVNYAAWLARRWHDPAFPRSFTWFNTERYWAEHILELREQLAAMQEEPLRLL
jgi:Ser/Thr protein kinase RdoA (MazF antagonist)